MTAVQHSHETNEHYGPRWLLDGVHELMGGVDLDPFSCAKANEVVRATRYYSLTERGEDGFRLPYAGRMYVNPPGGSVKHPMPLPGNRKRDHSSAALAWAILAHRWSIGEVDQAVFTIFNLETLRYSLGYPVPQPLDFVVLIPYDRIDFLDAELKEQGSPGHPNMIVWLPPAEVWARADRSYKAPELFERVFGERGKVFCS